MAVDQSLVDEERRKSLPYRPINLVDKLFKEHLDEFMAFGMAEAYCGDPAAASVEEGEALLELLSTFIIEDVERLFSGMGGDVKRGVYGR
jgi:creatinine amidohydrolase